MDGVDAVLVDISENSLTTIACESISYPPSLLSDLHQLCSPSENELHIAASADVQLAHVYHQAIEQLLQKEKLSVQEIVAVGSHGQTIRHAPPGSKVSDIPYTLQIGCPHTLATLCNIDIVADFRRKDLALGGQGAPLVPLFHQHMFGANDQTRTIVNIGGIANISVLSPHETPYGFDTGPGNTLLDAWTKKQLGKAYDNNGQWAATGKINQSLLKILLNDPYFVAPYPKSTGREHFHLQWLTHAINQLPSHSAIAPEDVQATLLALTARTIFQAISKIEQVGEVYICGGGAFNHHLVQSIQDLLKPIPVLTTQALDIDPQMVEGAAFAWFAHANIQRLPGNLTEVTGAKRQAVLGAFIPKD